MKFVVCVGPLTHSGKPELFIAKNCPVLPLGRRDKVSVAEAYSMSPFVKLDIPSVEVIMILLSSEDNLESSKIEDCGIPHSGTPDDPAVNTLPCVALIPKLDKFPFVGAYSKSPLLKSFVIPAVFVMIVFCASVSILDELSSKSICEATDVMLEPSP
jgi:hypothetical protein